MAKNTVYGLSVEDLENAGACISAQQQFKRKFGTKRVVWNKENYDKAMASYIRHGYYGPNSFGNMNYMNPSDLEGQMDNASWRNANHRYQYVQQDYAQNTPKERRAYADAVFENVDAYLRSKK
jgi:hypothetical protein